MRHLVHRQLAERLAFGHALGEQPRGNAVRVRHPVADEQDDVLGLPLPGAVDLPRHLAGVGAVGGPHLVDARLSQRHAAQDQRRLVAAVLTLDKLRGAAEYLLVVLAIERDDGRRSLHQTGELDLQIEPRAGEDRSAVDRIDGLGLRIRGGNYRYAEGGENHRWAHGSILENVESRQPKNIR